MPSGGFEVPTKGLGEKPTKGLGETLRIALHLRAALWVFYCCDFIVPRKKKKSLQSESELLKFPIFVFDMHVYGSA